MFFHSGRNRRSGGSWIHHVSCPFNSVYTMACCASDCSLANPGLAANPSTTFGADISDTELPISWSEA